MNQEKKEIFISNAEEKKIGIFLLLKEQQTC